MALIIDLFWQLFLQLVQMMLVVAVAPAVLGVTRKVKARLLRRIGPPVLQPYLDLWKLMHKEAVYAHNASWVYRSAPYIIFAATWVAAALVPSYATGLLFSWSADLIAIVALHVLDIGGDGVDFPFADCVFLPLYGKYGLSLEAETHLFMGVGVQGKAGTGRPVRDNGGHVQTVHDHLYFRTFVKLPGLNLVGFYYIGHFLTSWFHLSTGNKMEKGDFNAIFQRGIPAGKCLSPNKCHDSRTESLFRVPQGTGKSLAKVLFQLHHEPFKGGLRDIIGDLFPARNLFKQTFEMNSDLYHLSLGVDM